MSKETETLKRIAKQNKRFQAAVEAQRVALETYNATKKAEQEAYFALVDTNNRVDREKYLLVCAAIGQKPKPQDAL